MLLTDELSIKGTQAETGCSLERSSCSEMASEVLNSYLAVRVVPGRGISTSVEGEEVLPQFDGHLDGGGDNLGRMGILG